MKMPIEERRQIENEMLFRRANEKIGDDLGAIDAMHIEDHNFHLIRDDDLVLHFKCECSDENCSSRIPIKLSEYQTIHKDRDSFIVLPNHEFSKIEKVLQKKREYSVVKKNKSTSEPGNKLNTTVVTNI